jgi:GTP-binding protein EngB required for normal cell division
MNQGWDKVIELTAETARRYRISALEPLLGSCRAAASQKEISVAVLGRFKAGKSSFLNHLFRRELLPVGVVPVTAVVTEIEYGPKEKATVHFLDGHAERTSVDSIRQFIAESENPDNAKGVVTVKVEAPWLESLRGLRFVDTPGLESALAHNTEASLRWLPNVGLALVAVGIDTPLSQHDIELLENLRQYTPNISILLTKADLLDEAERAEVLLFVRERLARAGLDTFQILFYSVRPGYERFKARVEENLLRKNLADFERRRCAIIEQKLETLLGECADYLTLALASAETADEERDALRRQVFRHLQSFRDQLSERTVRVFGVPLRTAEIDLEIEEPIAPDIRIGKVFDRSWESISAITPMWLVKGIIARRFGNRLAWMVEKNLSRLATQWADSVNAAGAAIEREAERRLDELLATVTRLIASGVDQAPQIRADLASLDSARNEMRGAKSREVAG